MESTTRLKQVLLLGMAMGHNSTLSSNRHAYSQLNKGKVCYTFLLRHYQVPGFVQQQFRLKLQEECCHLNISFIENILRLNRGKMATVYMTFENNDEWNAKIFRGRVEEAGRDHIIIGDPETGMCYLLLNG